MKRVAITGMGLISPLGCGVGITWERLIRGESGAAKIKNFEVSDLSTQIACQVPRGDGSYDFRPEDYVTVKDRKKMDDYFKQKR